MGNNPNSYKTIHTEEYVSYISPKNSCLKQLDTNLPSHLSISKLPTLI